MKYQPKELNGNVNVSGKAPFKSMLSLLFSFLAAVLVIYIVLGFAVDILAARMPGRLENRIAAIYSPMLPQKIQHQESKKAERILQELIEISGKEGRYNIYVFENENVNAFAYPGRNILITSGLMDEIDSEEELAFVVAHELGHFAHRDHLRMIGRNLVFFGMSTFMFGQDSSVTNFFGRAIRNSEMRFSQRQETKADRFAAKLVEKRYGSIDGAIKFLTRMEEKARFFRWAHFFSTHPHPAIRIERIKKYSLNK